MRIAYIGNFRPRHSTENHVATAWRNRGHDVQQLQENHPDTWRKLHEMALEPYDVLLWTRTGWDWQADCGWSWERAQEEMRDVLTVHRFHGIPTVGFHLDRWWGLAREGQIHDEAFFRCDLVVTADGGHEQQWSDAGVNHLWLPPAVSGPECAPGRFDVSFEHDVVFVGSWQGGYHPEHVHRPALVDHLRGMRCKMYPERGQHAVRNEPLRDLYASGKVFVGDSCFVGDRYTGGRDVPVANYWSDRIPETCGRGGFLLHPETPGLHAQWPGLVTFPPGDFDRLDDLIDHYLSHPDERQDYCEANREWTLERHTYERRVDQIVEAVQRLVVATHSTGGGA